MQKTLTPTWFGRPETAKQLLPSAPDGQFGADGDGGVAVEVFAALTLLKGEGSGCVADRRIVQLCPGYPVLHQPEAL